MGWKTVEIDNGLRINLFLNNIIVSKDNNDKVQIPINDIDVLLINNYKLKITVQVINALTENNVLVIICDKKYLPQSLVVPFIGNFNTLKVMEKQIRWTNEYMTNIWTQIIAQKIRLQSEFLQQLQYYDAYNELCLLANQIQTHDSTNREGHAAKIYWHKLFGSEFKRHEDDYINLLLNYGYTILRGYVTRSIVKKGLDPRITFFHRSFHNYFALASDLMEPFRIAIDNIVYQLSISKSKHFYDDKNKILEFMSSKKIMINGKFQFINNAIDIWIDAIVNQDNVLPEIKIDYEWL